jgi:hypothetical protein
MSNPYDACPDDTDTVESLANELEETKSKLEMVLQYISQTHDAVGCENCGLIHPRSKMLTLYGPFIGTDNKEHKDASRYICGFCLRAKAAYSTQDVRDRAGEWLAVGYGRTFLSEQDAYYSHLGQGANQSPISEGLRVEFATEIQSAATKYAR